MSMRTVGLAARLERPPNAQAPAEKGEPPNTCTSSTCGARRFLGVGGGGGLGGEGSQGRWGRAGLGNGGKGRHVGVGMGAAPPAPVGCIRCIRDQGTGRGAAGCTLACARAHALHAKDVQALHRRWNPELPVGPMGQAIMRRAGIGERTMRPQQADIKEQRWWCVSTERHSKGSCTAAQPWPTCALHSPRQRSCLVYTSRFLHPALLWEGGQGAGKQ